LKQGKLLTNEKKYFNMDTSCPVIFGKVRLSPPKNKWDKGGDI